MDRACRKIRQLTSVTQIYINAWPLHWDELARGPGAGLANGLIGQTDQLTSYVNMTQKLRQYFKALSYLGKRARHKWSDCVDGPAHF